MTKRLSYDMFNDHSRPIINMVNTKRSIDSFLPNNMQKKFHFVTYCIGLYCFHFFSRYYIYILCIWSIPTKVMHIAKKTTLLHSPEFFSLYRRQVELSQKIYASSLYVIVAT